MTVSSQHQWPSSTPTTKTTPYDLPRLPIGGAHNNNSTAQSASLTRILNLPVSPKVTPTPAAPQSLPWILDPRIESASPKPPTSSLPPMNEYFPAVLAHVDFQGIPVDALPPIRAVFPATFTSPLRIPPERARADAHPAPRSSSSRANAKTSAHHYPFTFTYPASSAVTPSAIRAHSSRKRVLHPPGDPFPAQRFTHRFLRPRPQGLARRWAWGRGGHVREASRVRTKLAFAVPSRGRDMRVARGGGRMGNGKARELDVEVYTDPRHIVSTTTDMKYVGRSAPTRRATSMLLHLAYAHDAWYDAQLYDTRVRTTTSTSGDPDSTAYPQLDRRVVGGGGGRLG
ncbi:hypothetical protein C8R46DRAFT_1035430 [Mycena filopes]|nr:hypothetical protein C8R46DRAFT_1035430 [Mycena filopes]